MALIAGCAEHCPVEVARLEPRRNGHATPLAGDGVVHNDLFLPPAGSDKDTTVATMSGPEGTQRIGFEFGDRFLLIEGRFYIREEERTLATLL